MKKLMDKEDDKIVKILTKSELLDMILDGLNVEDANENQKEDPCREFTHNVKVLTFILGSNIPAYTGTADNTEEIKAAIDILVDHDRSLFGYTFFVASNTTFNYNWEYLRGKIEKFKEFMFNMNIFISTMLKDVNDIQNHFYNETEIEVLFDGVLGFTFGKGMVLAKCFVKWDDFYKISKVSNKEYYISIRVGGKTILCFQKKYKDDMSLIIDILSKTMKDDNNNAKV